MVIALLVFVWLALALRATRLEAEGADVVDRAQRGEITRGELDRGLDDLRRAREFNADAEPLLAEAALMADAGRHEEAIGLAERVVAAEPENLEGWVVVYLGALATDDAQRAARAARSIDELNPQLGERLRSRIAEGS